jgi:hypothetical protein
MTGPDLAGHWVQLLEDWIRERGLRGYDRFDVRAHPLIRAAQPYPIPRKITTGVTDLFPMVSRRILGVAPQENAKAFALVALGNLRRYQTTLSKEHLAIAREHLQWLLDHPSTGYSGLCWGYPFDVFAKGLDTPRHTPVVVVSAIAGAAFSLAWRITEDEEYRAALRSIAQFIEEDIPRLDWMDGTYCFAYTPGDRRRVHNANLHAAAHLVRTFTITGERHLLDLAVPAIEFTLKGQRDNGAWPYGEHAPDDPYEAKLLSLVDHHHTGFVLRSLLDINAHLDEDRIREAIQRGFTFYREKLFDTDGAPVTTYGRYPIDIHACAEGILCPSALSVLDSNALAIAERTMRWTREHMSHPSTGVPYYRKYPWITSRLYCPRWGLAWIYFALCEYLCAVEAQRRQQTLD